MFVEEYKSKIQPVLENGGDEHKTLTVSEEEQKEVENYVLNKEMIRPSTSFLSVFGWFIVACVSAFGLTSLAFLFFNFGFDVFVLFIKKQISENTFSFFLVIFIFSFLLILFIFRNAIAIGFVHLYQHYSPEEKRRSCLFKPTCSEYAIIAINKYGFSRALPKIIDRCKRCHGDVYRIDYP